MCRVLSQILAIQKVANEIIRYKQAKGRLPTSLSWLSNENHVREYTYAQYMVIYLSEAVYQKFLTSGLVLM
jgi:hypothetical protein